MEKFVLFLTALFTMLIIGLILGTCVMLLWNWLMPVIFGLPTISWLQGLGLYYLSQFLFCSHTTINNDK